jgi:HPt (histidine-containing phosphotransfer) domain-containing protein
MQSIHPSAVLDREQLRDITMDDEDLMREILSVLVDDTSTQIPKLESAVLKSDSGLCMRLAHYCKGACSNVGANAAAQVFRDIERQARDLEFQRCTTSLAALATEMERLRAEVTTFAGPDVQTGP